MSVHAGSEIIVEATKPAAGGRMLARHEGQVVLVRGTIPGERIRARVERVGRGVLYAETMDVLVGSPDRRPGGSDPGCGGAVYAHIAYERQRRLKGEILADALARIGRFTRPVPEVVGSPEHGYRMRARLHVRAGRLGFFREGTHDLCDAASTLQLLPGTAGWIADVEAALARDRLAGLEAIELAENIPGTERACHLELGAGVDAAPFACLADVGPLAGISASHAGRPGVERLAGMSSVSDVLHVHASGAPAALRLRRDVRAFFQGNRFLLEPLARHVVGLVREGPVVDLYAGVGLFGLSLAAAGIAGVTLVESDAVSAASLLDNAEAFGTGVRVERCTVESFLERTAASARDAGGRTLIGPDTTIVVDPPRTGMSRAASTAIAHARAGRIVYVSCDPATFARDTRILLDAGYEMEGLTGFDLFPNTAHVEAVASFAHVRP